MRNEWTNGRNAAENALTSSVMRAEAHASTQKEAITRMVSVVAAEMMAEQFFDVPSVFGPSAAAAAPGTRRPKSGW